MEIQRVSLFRTCCTICIKSICDDYVRKCSGMVVDACSRAKFHLVRSSSYYPIIHSIKHVTAAISVRPPMITSNYGPVSLLWHGGQVLRQAAKNMPRSILQFARLFVVRLIACIIRWRQSSEAVYSGTCWKYLCLNFFVVCGNSYQFQIKNF
jgi:hypothetical protein